MVTSTVLGLDLGTTTVKATVINADSYEVLGTWSCETRATVCSDAGSLASEQDVSKIMSAVETCMLMIPPDLKSKVIGIGVCGQMHGLVLWKKASPQPTGTFSGLNVAGQFSKLSHLYTWQDGRCSAEFLASLPPPNSHLRVATGFGCATIFWLNRHEPGSLEVYDCAGTVQDFLVTALCHLDMPVMSSQNAASWGYFDTMKNVWNTEM
jgi:sedoheptulokinase